MGSSLITPDPGTIVWTVVTFVILAFLLGRFAGKPLLQLLEGARADGPGLARGEPQGPRRGGGGATQEPGDPGRARRESAAILEQGKREVESLKGEILTQARKEAQELVEQGKRQVQLRAEAGDGAATEPGRRPGDPGGREADRPLPR